MNLKDFIRDVPDFPQKGIIFKDITTLISNPEAFRYAVEKMVEPYREKNIDKIIGIESRGFLFGGAMAYILNCGINIARKPGKLPWKTIKEEYTLEYGTNALEIHVDAVKQGERVLIVDDLLATGGTALAVVKLVEKLGGKVEGISFLIELEFLKGRDKLAGYPVNALIKF